MRQLHPVGWQERFLAGGLYVHQANGQPTGETEQWTQHRLPDGAVIARVDWQRTTRAEFVLIEAWRASEVASTERFDIHIYGSNAPTVRASFHMFSDHLEYNLNRDGDSLSETLALPHGSLVDPGAAIFAGLFAASGDQHPVVVLDPATAQPYIDSVVVRRAGDDSVTIGSETVVARVYNEEWTRGGVQTLWLDAHGIPLQIERGGDAIHLTSYVRAPEASKR